MKYKMYRPKKAKEILDLLTQLPDLINYNPLIKDEKFKKELIIKVNVYKDIFYSQVKRSKYLKLLHTRIEDKYIILPYKTEYICSIIEVYNKKMNYLHSYPLSDLTYEHLQSIKYEVIHLIKDFVIKI